VSKEEAVSTKVQNIIVQQKRRGACKSEGARGKRMRTRKKNQSKDTHSTTPDHAGPWDALSCQRGFEIKGLDYFKKGGGGNRRSRSKREKKKVHLLAEGIGNRGGETLHRGK